jgi:hypothetical protein
MTRQQSARSRAGGLRGFLGLLWLAWRFWSGYSAHECDPRRPGACGAQLPLEHRVALRWHHLPRWGRSGIALAVTAVVYGLLAQRAVTLSLLAVLAFAALAAGAWQCAYFIRGWRHERHYVRPLERTLVHKIRQVPESVEVDVSHDKDTGAVEVKSVRVEWPPDAEIGTDEQRLVLDAVTARLPIDAPEQAWNLKGRQRLAVFTPSEPPPFPVSWEDVAQAVARLAANELLFGIGKHGAIIKAAYSDSPHLMIPGGSGGGKSNLAAVLLLVEMLRGSIIFNLDPKWTSHLWLQDLPNVINAHSTEDLHVALTWLGTELKRRTRVAHASANGTGRIRGSVGPRIIALCEELNYGMPDLKELWQEMRAQDKTLPKRSTAIAGLAGVSCAGRASDIHAWLIAQLMTVESTGVKDSTIRTNAGIKAMVRWDSSGWPLACGKSVPMPPPTAIPGRIQLVTGDACREAQVPYLQLVAGENADAEELAAVDKAVKWARELAVSGTVAKIPTGPGGIPRQLWPPSVLGQERLALSAGQGAGTPGTVPGSVPQMPPMTLSQAHAAGIYGDGQYETVRKAVQRLADRAPEPAERGRPGLPHKWTAEDHHAMAKELERR